MTDRVDESTEEVATDKTLQDGEVGTGRRRRHRPGPAPLRLVSGNPGFAGRRRLVVAARQWR